MLLHGLCCGERRAGRHRNRACHGLVTVAVTVTVGMV